MWTWGMNDKGQLGLGDKRAPPDCNRTAVWEPANAGWEYTALITTQSDLYLEPHAGLPAKIAEPP